MPVYLYRCLSCRVKFEVTQMFSDKPLARCPQCHKHTVRRIPQLPAILFKGSGWYSIDHRSAADQKTNAQNIKNDKAGSTIGNGSER